MGLKGILIYLIPLSWEGLSLEFHNTYREDKSEERKDIYPKE